MAGPSLADLAGAEPYRRVIASGSEAIQGT